MTTPKPEYRDLVFSMDDPRRPLMIKFPWPMSQEEIADVKDVLAIWLRMLERSALAHNDETKDANHSQEQENGDAGKPSFEDDFEQGVPK